MLQNIGTTEIVIIALVILMLFGAKRIPEFAKGMVKAKKEFSSNFEDDKTKEDKKEN